MGKTNKRHSFLVMALFFFISLPLTVQADPSDMAGEKQSKIIKVIRIELPISTKSNAKSPATPEETPEQRFMRIVQQTPRSVDLVRASSSCNEYTKPCFSW